MFRVAAVVNAPRADLVEALDQRGEDPRVPVLEGLHLLLDVAGVPGLVGGLDVDEEEVGVAPERVEGSVTRLLAIFHSTDSVPVGPVRSARTSDIAIFTPLHHPYVAWSGANPTFARRIRGAAAHTASTMNW